MEALEAVAFVAVLVAVIGGWLYGVFHPLLNHGRLGIALLGFLVPVFALGYALLHRCPVQPAT